MLRGYAFRPRWWAAALAAAGCAVFVLLGNWQSRRADEKRAPLPRAVVQGEFLPRHTVYLDNRTRRGKVGYEIVTPLRLRGSSAHVLVNRGWVEAGKTRDVLPEVRTPAGTVLIEGIQRERLPRTLHFLERGQKVRQNLKIEDYASETGLQLQPRVIEQYSDSGDGLLRDWPRAPFGPEKHQAYAVQWYSLAALAVVLFVVLSFRRVA